MPAKTGHLLCDAIFSEFSQQGHVAAMIASRDLPSRTQALIIADTASERCGEPVGEPSLSDCWLASVKSQCARFCRGG